MKQQFKQIIDKFCNLKTKLQNIDSKIIDQAKQDNPWFTNHDISYALRAIEDKMLDSAKLEKWIANYDFKPKTSKKVGIIMAGNLPLVGFADLLYVIFSGATPVVKPSSKDSALMNFVIETLEGIEILDENSKLDAIIATGSDNAKQYFQEKYGDIPALLRGTKHSVAILENDLSTQEMQALADDIFLHSGLGCRSVSHLVVPHNFDFKPLIEVLSQRANISTPYKNNYRQNKALKTLKGEKFLDGGFFTLSKGAINENLYLSNISYSHSLNSDNLQCLVGRDFIPFGKAQQPELWDYADNIDVMKFIKEI